METSVLMEINNAFPHMHTGIKAFSNKLSLLLLLSCFGIKGNIVKKKSQTICEERKHKFDASTSKDLRTQKKSQKQCKNLSLIHI